MKVQPEKISNEGSGDEPASLGNLGAVIFVNDDSLKNIEDNFVALIFFKKDEDKTFISIRNACDINTNLFTFDASVRTSDEA